MNGFSGKSDKSFKWSDYGNPNQLIPSSKTKTSPSAASIHWFTSASRLPHRNLQTLRQTHMQMPQRQGAWPKVLPIHQLPRPKTQDGLCFQRKKRSSADILRQSPKHEIDHGTNQRDQPRTACTTGVVLGVFSNRHHTQHQRCRCYCCQYGVRLLSCRAQRRGQLS